MLKLKTLNFYILFIALIFSNALCYASEIYKFRLYNGMEFFLIKTKNPIITYSTWINAGGANETNSLGVAHFLEHMMFKDNKRYNSKEVEDILQGSGGEYNAFTNYDYTVFYNTVPNLYLKNIMKLESSRFNGLKFKKEQFNFEKQVILEERGLRVDNDPLTKFLEQTSKYIFNNNYGRSLIGSIENINNITISDLKDFYNKWYVPQNAKVFVIGDVSLKELKRYAHRYYGGIPKEKNFKNKEALFLGDTIYKNNVDIKIKNPDIIQNIYMTSFLAPSLRNTKDVNVVIALELLKEYLNSQNSVFYNNLVLNYKYATSISVSYNAMAKLNTNFIIYALPEKNVSINTLKVAINNELNKISEYGIPENKLNILIKNLKDSHEFMEDDDREYSFYFANFIMNGFNIETFKNFINNENEINVSDVNKIIKKFLKNNKLIIDLTK